MNCIAATAKYLNQTMKFKVPETNIKLQAIAVSPIQIHILPNVYVAESNLSIY